MKVMIVDDEYYALEGMRHKLLAMEDIEVIGMYEDSIVFLDAVQKSRSDLVFMDIEMPRLNGMEVLAKLRTMKIAVPVVFVTAYSHYRDKILQTDAIGYIFKPVTKERLEAVLDKARKKVF